MHHGRMFKSRMVREIKGKSGEPYEKSHLAIQGHDFEKLSILTQSPTIQRMSQLLILAIAMSLCRTGMTVSLRHITSMSLDTIPTSMTNICRTSARIKT